MAENGNNPNINMFPLESVENEINQAIYRLLEIEPTNDQQLELRDMCIEDLKELQDCNLLALRRAIEE